MSRAALLLPGLKTPLRPLLLCSGLALLAACHDRDVTHTVPSASLVAVTSVTSAPAKPAPSSATAMAFNSPDRFSKRPYMPDVMELGRVVFNDPELSASKKLSCATCHDPHFGYGPNNDRSTQLGGPDGNIVGLRAVPSLRYQQAIPSFTEHYYDEDNGESDQGPTGGHTWDGRSNTLHDQARLPLTSPFEMANDSIDSVVAKVRAASYAPRFKQVFGDDVFTDATRGTTAVLLALEAFQDIPKDFYPYNSRYDAWLRGQVQLTKEERRGLALFNDRNKANCAHCHPSQPGRGGFPAFTDFGFNAIGVPRNRAIPDNSDPAFFDLGLCGPLRTDLVTHREYCGAFRAPTLRNVTRRKVFFHNGVLHKLEDVIDFYLTRDSNPRKWYPKGNAHTRYDDLPPDAQQNVNQEPPFGRKPGQAPALSKAEIKDLIAFLDTLTDADLVTPTARP
jgi:cytochrome c peroxidase